MTACPGPAIRGCSTATGGASAAYIQNVFDLVKPVVQATIELLSAGHRQVKDRQKELLARASRPSKTSSTRTRRPIATWCPTEPNFPIALLPEPQAKPAAMPTAGQGHTADDPD